LVDEFVEELHKRIHRATEIKAALHRLQELISSRYPTATFRVSYGFGDPFGVQLIPQLDTGEELDEVVDCYIDELTEYDLAGLPVQIFPERRRQN
jgi:hypothetical protein